MTMIEKVARAICHKDDNDWDFNVNEYYKKEYTGLAKAAIEAMRDIDDEALDSHYGYEYRQIIDAALKED